jgi:SAM-dependent methyltransferase|tara:strand:- start:5858 stop:6505 length:648 start_codon:yes stop_codon:yes gene_type:complete
MAYEHIALKAVDVDVDAAYADASAMVEKYPWRGAAVVAHALAPYIQGKVVCDLGCGGGDLAWLMGRWAKEVVGVEFDSNRLDKALVPSPARVRDNVTFKKLDYFASPIPDADVYYFWPNEAMSLLPLMEMLEEREKPLLLIGGARLDFLQSEIDQQEVVGWSGVKKRCLLLSYVDKHDGEVVTFPSHEDSDLVHTGQWDHNDIWCLCVIPLGGHE